MKLLIQNNRIAGTATDDYSGPDVFIDAPADFDLARMGEYEFIDGTVIMPAITISKAIKKIDSDTDSIYGDVLGNRTEEYTSALEDALAYKESSYTGSVPVGVSSLATAKSWTPKKAADDIITMASTWKTAQDVIRTNRLATKEKVKNSATSDEIIKSIDDWSAFVTEIRSQLGI